jgi:hypothetical protein
MYEACTNGHLEIVKLIHNHHIQLHQQSTENSKNPTQIRSNGGSAQSGHTVHRSGGGNDGGLNLKYYVSLTSSAGHFHILQHLLNTIESEICISSSSSFSASKTSTTDRLQIEVQQQPDSNHDNHRDNVMTKLIKEAMDSAISQGHTEIVQYLIDLSPKYNCVI